MLVLNPHQEPPARLEHKAYPGPSRAPSSHAGSTRRRTRPATHIRRHRQQAVNRIIRPRQTPNLQTTLPPPLHPDSWIRRANHFPRSVSPLSRSATNSATAWTNWPARSVRSNRSRAFRSSCSRSTIATRAPSSTSTGTSTGPRARRARAAACNRSPHNRRTRHLNTFRAHPQNRNRPQHQLLLPQPNQKTAQRPSSNPPANPRTAPRNETAPAQPATQPTHPSPSAVPQGLNRRYPQGSRPPPSETDP